MRKPHTVKTQSLVN